MSLIYVVKPRLKSSTRTYVLYTWSVLGVPKLLLNEDVVQETTTPLCYKFTLGLNEASYDN